MSFAKVAAMTAAALTSMATPCYASNGLPTFQTLYSFDVAVGDGAIPRGGLAVYKDSLFGATLEGGAGSKGGGGSQGYGTIFEFNIASGTESVVKSFGKSGPSDPSDFSRKGKFGYAALTSDGGDSAISKIDLATLRTKTLATFPDGNPSSPVVVGDELYVTCQSGGASGRGVVLAISANTGAVTTLYQFTGGIDGGIPFGPLTNANGALYGTALIGGTSDRGVIFQIDPTSGAETVLYSFTGGVDGANPNGMVYASGSGLLYGTTEIGETSGGVQTYGTVFSFNPATGTLTTLYTFTNGTDGGTPQWAPTLYRGKLYGTTTYGGSSNNGALWDVDLATGTETTLVTFDANRSNGAQPDGGLVASGGVLYGTTQFGGANSNGTIFSLTIK
jgi:uncharacterized repeat protein (TIGR03803 family)